MWHGYWTNRLLAMRREGIAVESRPLRYRTNDVVRADGSVETSYVPQEKGIDLRLGLDVVRLARVNQLDVAVIFSQDQDLAEVVKDVREIARDSGRWIKVVSAYPVGPEATAKRGIDRTDWYPINQDLYNACLDTRDYRQKSSDNATPKRHERTLRRCSRPLAPCRSARSLCTCIAAAVPVGVPFVRLRHPRNGIPDEPAQQRFAAAPLKGVPDSELGTAPEVERCEIAGMVLAGAAAGRRRCSWSCSAIWTGP